MKKIFIATALGLFAVSAQAGNKSCRITQVNERGSAQLTKGQRVTVTEGEGGVYTLSVIKPTLAHGEVGTDTLSFEGMLKDTSLSVAPLYSFQKGAEQVSASATLLLNGHGQKSGSLAIQQLDPNEADSQADLACD